MSDQGHLYLFGDQTSDFVPGLRQLLRVKDSPLLAFFLERTHYALREEISRQPGEVQSLLPRFSRIVDLLASYSVDADSNAALASTLTVIYQLGSFIRYHEDGSKSRPYPSGQDHVVLGMCTGQLAACAVASAASVMELVPLAVEVVVIALRVGLHVTKIRELLEDGPAKHQPWSYIIPKLSAGEASSRIEQFSQSANLPSGSRPFVGTVAASSVTVFGHPDTLKAFTASPFMSDVKSLPASVFAPYHGSHLYSQEHVSDILSGLPSPVSRVSAKLRMISSTTGEPMEAATLYDLLNTSLGEILRQSLRLDSIAQSLATSCNAASHTKWLILTVGANAPQNLANALSENQTASVTVEAISSSSTQGIGRTPLPNDANVGRQDQSKIAIIGYSGRFPEAIDPESLWELLHEGRDVHREIPPDRFNVETHYDPTGKKKNASQVRNGCFINEPGLFDCRFFNLSPKEADQSDPGQRLALMTAYEALEMGGIVPDATPSTQRDRVGIFYGMTSDDWREVNSGQDVGTYFIPGGNRAFTPGRINYHFKFSGPSVSVDTACSSSAAAIHMACNSLWRNDCDTAIAGGTNVMTNPDNFTGLDKGHFLSRTGNCKTFDDGADGYCRADAVGTVILKRLEDALADKDPIQAVICGAYTNHSADAESITRPFAGAQAAIFRRILNDAGHEPLDVSYIEMHGTGTQAGDAVEMRSVLDVFTGKSSGRSANDPLYLGSVKSNVGHAESGSGVTSLIKVLLMMKNSEIPPHCGIKTKLNTGFPKDLAERGIRIALEATPWQRPTDGRRRMAFLNNFSAAGGNSALLLEDAPSSSDASPSTADDPRTCHVVTVSARTPKSLLANTQRLARHLSQNSKSMSLGSLSYTTTARRMHHNYRLAVTGRSVEDITAALEDSAVSLANSSKPIPRKAPTVAFAFTGQGSVYAGMGQHLFDSFGVFREELRRLSGISMSFGFDPFLELIRPGSTEGGADFQATPQATQLALVCFEISLARLWKSFGVTPGVVVGHSLGEYAALHIAGVLSARDVVFLVGSRARIMQERCSAGSHAMLAAKAPLSDLSAISQEYGLDVACLNGPTQTVLAGLVSDVGRAEEAMQQQLGIKSTRLETPFAFHSSQLDPVLEEYKAVARGVVFRKPRCPILSPLLGRVVTDEADFDPDYLVRHCREPVNLLSAVQDSISQQLISDETICLEIGPDAIVSRMIKSVVGPSTRIISGVKKNQDPWETLSDAVSSIYRAGVDVQWSEYHRDFNESLHVVSLPSYQWDYKNHWIQYVHDWCLTKGDAPKTDKATTTRAAAPDVQTTYESLSSTCQKVLRSQHGAERSEVLVESDMSHPDLRAVFEKHKVNGAVLCPSSVYADIAMTLGDYLTKHNPRQANSGIEVADMATTKPLLMRNPGKPELFRVSAEADWDAQEAKVAFYSVTASGEKSTEHATCTLRFGDAEAWKSDWKRIAHLVQGRMRCLRDASGQAGSSCHLIKRGMVYKLFENCVEYGDSFQGIEGVYLDSKAHEATAWVNFQDKSTCFFANPYYIDSLGHISGFVMNATEAFDYKSQVFLNHGWESIRCAVKLSPEETYQTYVKMNTSDGKKYVGDVYIFHGEDIIGVNQGVAFQSVPRKVLNMLLPTPARGGSTLQTTTTKPSPAVDALKVKKQPPARMPQSVPAESRVLPSDPREGSAPAPPELVLVMQAIKIIAEEIGISPAEMSNELEFADAGVDSLLSLTVCGRLREELNMDISSSLFMDCPTVRDLKRYLGPAIGPMPVSSCGSSSDDTQGSGRSDQGEESDATSIDDDFEPKQGHEMAVMESSSISGEKPLISALCSILADEVGVQVEEIWNAPSLSDLGVDSLMSLQVLGRLREELDLDLPTDIFFHDNMPTIREKLLGTSTQSSMQDTASKSSTALDSTLRTSSLVRTPEATSVVLQGSLKTAQKVLFLFPDGSGSATSYAGLPKVAQGVAVVGLNCPYMKRPQDLKCSLADLTRPYLAEIRRRQPRGPYHLGGWSAGGICAYDAAQILIAGGEAVESLILLDSPNPIHLEKLPTRLYHFLSGVGVFGSGDPGKPLPEWLLPHFLAFVDALALYEPDPFPPGKAPSTHAIWAADGVYRSTGGKRLEKQADDTRELRWLLEDRVDFGPNGWDTLVGVNKLRMQVLQGANHFTMFDGQQGQQLSRFIAKSLGI